MHIHVVSAEIQENVWRAIKAFVDETDADMYAQKIYEIGYLGDKQILDSRVDEVNLED